MSGEPEAGPADRGPGSMSLATWGWFLALVGWTALVCFYDLDGGARFEPTDCWVAQTAREMQAGDFPRNQIGRAHV